MNAFFDKFGADFRTQQGKKELVDLVTVLAPPRIKNRARGMFENILKYSSIKQFTEELYRSAVRGRTIVLGEVRREEITISGISGTGIEHPWIVMKCGSS